MAELFKNNASSTLAAAVTTSATTIFVKSGEGGKFPSPTGGDFFRLTLYQVVNGKEANHEITYCTARSGDTLTVTRAQEGTAARAFNTYDPVSHRMTAGVVTDFALLTNLAALSGASLIGFRQSGSSTNRTLQAKGYEYLTLEDFGAVGDGIADDSAAVQTAFNESAANKRKLIVPKGSYRCVTDLNLVSNLDVEFVAGAILTNASASGGTTGFIKQADLTTKISNIKWKGGTIKGIDAATSAGNVFCFYGDDISIDGVTIDGFGGPGRAFLIGGDRIRLTNGKVVSPFAGAGSGGIRVAGGDGFICSDYYVHSGDDCFQFVTGESNTGVLSLFDKTITNGTYANCYGISDEGRIIIAQVNDAFVSMSASLIGCSFENIHGQALGPNGALLLGAETAYALGHTGSIRDITVSNCYLESNTDAAGTIAAARLLGSATHASAVRNLRLENTTIKIMSTANVETVKISGLQSFAEILGCTLYANTNGAATLPTVNVFQGQDVRIENNTIYQSTSHALRTPNSAPNTTNRLIVKGNVFRDCAGTVVFDNYTSEALYKGNTFVKKTGGAAATGIYINTPSLHARIETNNYLNGIETPVTLIPASVKFSDMAPITNVLTFGAKGDGVTDDDTAFTAAQTFVGTGGSLWIPKGTYKRGATSYSIQNDFLWIQKGLTSGVNAASSAQNNGVLVTTETSTDSPIDSTKTRIGISITAVAKGAQHATGIRSNLSNYSTDGAGCTAVYAQAVSDTAAFWSAALHGETRHAGGTSSGMSSESQSFSNTGAFYGAVINNTTAAGTTHPITGAAPTSHSGATALFIQGANDVNAMGGWARGVSFGINSMRAGGIGIFFQSTATVATHIQTATDAPASTADIFLQGNSQNGIVLAGTYTSSAIRVPAGQAISLENTAVIKFLYDSGTARVQWRNSATERFSYTLSATPALFLNGTQVVTVRNTGWTAMTGTTDKATAYDTATITLAQLAARVKTLQDTLAAHGLIGS